MKAFDLMNSLGLEGRVQAGIPMRELTTMRVGGAADCVVHAANEQDIAKVVRTCRENGLLLTLVGRGSNLVVRDGGLRGVALHLGAEFSRVTVEGDCVTAQAGATLGALARTAQQHGLAGLEFAEGIPGSVGGGVYMNAGAYGGQLSDVLTEVELLRDGMAVRVPASEMDFGYRHSLLSDRPEAVVLSAVFRLTPGDRETIREKMRDLMARRKASQPLEWPSAGSTFKRPTGYFAGTLIDQCGLKGLTVGGAQVSEKHAGFVINTGGATCADVKELIRQVQERVLAEKGVRLEPEVKIIG